MRGMKVFNAFLLPYDCKIAPTMKQKNIIIIWVRLSHNGRKIHKVMNVFKVF